MFQVWGCARRPGGVMVQMVQVKISHHSFDKCRNSFKILHDAKQKQNGKKNHFKRILYLVFNPL